MSILINGMEMPKSCWDCYFQDCGNCLLNSHKAVDKNIVEDRIDEDCPLIEIPPHGRLIDADALPIDIEWEDIVNAPTVIEAVVSEEELQREYEANVEYAQYCERYEPTYDPNTGGM